MNTHRKLTISIFILVGLGIVGTAIAYYTAWTPITTPTITSHNDYDIVFAGSDVDLVCTQSTDTDCSSIPYDHSVSDPVVHTWSGPGTFTPTTGTTTTWTAPTTTGDKTITVTASDDGVPTFYNDTDKTDSVILTVTNIIYVDKDATGNDDGTTWANAFDTIQEAVNASVPDNEIWVAEGTYTLTSVIWTGSRNIGIYGGFDATETQRSQRDWKNNKTIVDGDNSVSCFGLTGSTNTSQTIDGFTIINGYDVTGAGICCYNGIKPTIRNCVLSGHYGLYGGSAINCDGDITVENCVFIGNQAYDDGAAMRIVTGDPTITNCVFVDNSAGRFGGAITNATGANGTITNCIFIGNSADDGGAIYNSNNSDPTITNCIFWDNIAATSGEEVYNYDDASDPVFSYCNIDGGINGTKFGGYDCVDGGGNIDSDPKFVDDTDEDGDDNIWMTSDDGLAIESVSPCIDAADGSNDPTTDILGNSRYDDPSTSNTGVGDPNYVDMGAYEYQGS